MIDSTFNCFDNKITKHVVLPNDYKQNNLLYLNIVLIPGRSITSVNYNNLIDPLYGQANYLKEYYYLVKGVITEKVTKLNATIGIEVRGMYPNRTPSISAYLGFLITPSDFFKSKP